MTEQPTNSYLPRKTFFWVMSIIVGVIMSVIGGLTAIVLDTQSTFNHSFTEVKVDIAKMQTDLEWLITEQKQSRNR